MTRLIYFLLAVLLWIGCSRKVTNSTITGSPMGVGVALPSPPCFIYKTRADYAQNVPVILSGDKKVILSFPGIKDLIVNGQFAYPTQLAGGYLLDNRGIGQDVAFLRYTYPEYSSLSKTPTAAELWDFILDKDPLTELYRCGAMGDYTDLVEDLNRLINDGKINSCIKLK